MEGFVAFGGMEFKTEDRGTEFRIQETEDGGKGGKRKVPQYRGIPPEAGKPAGWRDVERRLKTEDNKNSPQRAQRGIAATKTADHRE